MDRCDSITQIAEAVEPLVDDGARTSRADPSVYLRHDSPPSTCAQKQATDAPTTPTESFG